LSPGRRSLTLPLALLRACLPGRSPCGSAGDWELPLVVQLLRREMEVAVAAEDYALAARLRDHPYTKLSQELECSRCALCVCVRACV
jgi:hypothetical protein